MLSGYAVRMEPHRPALTCPFGMLCGPVRTGAVTAPATHRPHGKAQAMSRDRYGDGSVYELGDGSGWMANLYGSDGRRRRARAATKREALAALKRLQKEDSGTLGSDSTLGDLIDEWKANVADRKSEPTSRNYDWALGLAAGLRSRKLSDLRPAHIDAELERLARRQRRPLSLSSLSRVRGNLRAVLKYGVGRRYLDWNPADFAVLPVAVKPARETQALTLEEVRALLASVKGDRLEPLLITSLLLGLRPGEALGLPWANVDLDAGVVVIDRQLVRRQGTFVIERTKGRGKQRSDRTVRLSDELVAKLKAHKARQTSERLASSMWEDSGFVFTDEIGAALSSYNVLRWFKARCADAGIASITRYGARHTWASLFVDADAPLKTMSEAAGHADYRMMTEHYLHKTAPVVDLRQYQSLILSGS